MKVDEVKIGTPVIYWLIIDKNGQGSHPFETEITSEPWQLGSGEIVCKVKGKTGGISIRHLQPIRQA